MEKQSSQAVPRIRKSRSDLPRVEREDEVRIFKSTEKAYEYLAPQKI